MSIEETLAAEGPLHSSGQFTLDAGAALRKLRERLLQPEDCLLYLTQSAVASGANWIEVAYSSKGLTFRHDGFFPEPDRLPLALEWALGTSENIPRHRFALALASALTPPGDGLILEYSGKTVTVTTGSKGLQFETISRGDRPMIHLPIRQSWLSRFLSSVAARYLKRLRDRAGFAPIYLKLDGRQGNGEKYGMALPPRKSDEENRPDVSGHHCIEVRLPVEAGTGSRLALPLTAWHAPHYVGPTLEQCRRTLGHGYRQHDVAECSAALAWRVDAAAKLEVVQFGISLQTPKSNLPGRLWMLFADDSLATDLSCLRLVDSPELRAKMASLNRLFEGVKAPLEKRYQATAATKATNGFELWVLDWGRNPV